MTVRLALLGHPVSHSRSPFIHQAFGQALGLSVQYDTLDLPPETVDARVRALLKDGFVGFNVTVPYKETACGWAHQLTARAERAGAVNTLVPLPDQPGQWLGDTTDGAGLVRDLVSVQGLQPAAQRILLLGAGGAVRGVLEPLLAAGPACLHIANRTRARAEALVDRFQAMAAAHGVTLTASGFDDLEPGWDWVINGTAASLGGEVPPLPAGTLGNTRVSYDMMYAPTATPFNQWAAAQGVPRCMDGLGMLVGQAAESFQQWTGRAPAVEPVLKALRAELDRD